MLSINVGLPDKNHPRIMHAAQNGEEPTEEWSDALAQGGRVGQAQHDSLYCSLYPHNRAMAFAQQITGADRNSSQRRSTTRIH